MNNQSATRKLFLLQFHWVLTKTTFDFHPRIQPLVNITVRQRRNGTSPGHYVKKAKHAGKLPPHLPSATLRDQSIEPSLATSTSTDPTPSPNAIGAISPCFNQADEEGDVPPTPRSSSRSVRQILPPQLQVAVQSLSSRRLIYFHYPVGARRLADADERGGKRAGSRNGNNAVSPKSVNTSD